ncbi:MAG TPA: DnaJ domain-containing protein [Kiloniellaceae bacterium]|nr:DnaJ domain-containing protein [Kiloniellaceae bacterium]
MQYFILGVALLVALLFIGRWFVEADPHKVASGLKWGALLVGGFILLALLVSGRIALLAALVPAGFWAFRLFQRYRSVQGPRAGQTSEVRTRFLEMSLDHDSGQLDGRVLDGRHAGALLSQLDLAALMELLEDYRIGDAQSASVLEAYLDRARPEWREAEEAEAPRDERSTASGRRGPPPSGSMTRAEALEVLGLEEGADAEAIRDAHRRLMQKLHPDHGGSNYLAAKLNEAKELLLRP